MSTKTKGAKLNISRFPRQSKKAVAVETAPKPDGLPTNHFIVSPSERPVRPQVKNTRIPATKKNENARYLSTKDLNPPLEGFWLEAAREAVNGQHSTVKGLGKTNIASTKNKFNSASA